MKKLILAVALTTALAACSNAAEEPAAEDTAAATEAAAPTEAASTMAGTYEYEYEGTAMTTVMMPDGMYTDSDGDKVTEKGAWAEKDGKTCFDPEGDDTAEVCWTTTEPDADGVFTATSDDGKTTLTIKKTA